MSRHLKLLVALGAGALAMMALVGHLIWSAYREALHAAETTTRGYAAILEARLDATLRRADADLRQLARAIPTAALRQDAVSRNAHLPALMNASLINFPELAALNIFAANGDLLYTTSDVTARTNIADRRHFTTLRDNPGEELVFSEVIISRLLKRPVLTVVRALRGTEGSFNGVVAALIDLERFEKLFQSLNVGAGSVVSIYRSDNFTQVVRWPKGEGPLNAALPLDSPGRSVLLRPDRTATFELTAATDNRARIYSRHVLNSYPFFVAVGVARDVVLAGWRRRALVDGLSAALLLGLLLGLQYWKIRGDAARLRLATIVDASNDAILSRDLKGTILSWNRGAELLFGYHADEMLGRNIRILVPPQLHHELRSGEEASPNFQARSHDSVRLAKDGRLIDVSISASPIKDTAGTVCAVAVIFRDITQRKQSERMQAQLAAIVESSDDAIIARAPDDTIISWNAAAERIFGWSVKEALGAPFQRLLSVDPQQPDERLRRVLQGENLPWFEEIRARKDGTHVHVQTTLSEITDAQGKILFVSCTMRDVTERVKAARHIEHLATKDTLTGLANRSALLDAMNTAIVRAESANHRLAVMFVDLDRFKEVNDTLGHAAGDELLRECARRLTQCVRDQDIVARLGGDEFVVLLTDIADVAIVTPIAERMLKLLNAPYHVLGHDANTSASIGICLYPTDGRDATALMKNADIAMYQAKNEGRNNFQFYAEEMNQRMMRRLQLEQELRSAVENQEFVLHYQPQVSFATGDIQGAESLIRWRHPVRGLLPPAEFIAVAEETGLILAIGEWTLNHACATIKAWRASGVNVPYIVVNVSAVQLGAGLVDTVRQALVTHGIEAGWLMLEITETMLMERVEEAITILRRIRELGIRIAMDDFGTGYSSLSVLQRLPLDTLKIDRSFVSAIDDDANNARACAIIGAIIAIAKELDLSVVAEGVETPTQLAFLRTLNCDTYQGYLYSAPIDTVSMEARFTSPAKSVLEDEDGRAISMTIKVNLELPLETLP
jgi:diguanylate cyclase (GGDEF)-like protein/PAS domain S-box-containing protein